MQRFRPHYLRFWSIFLVCFPKIRRLAFVNGEVASGRQKTEQVDGIDQENAGNSQNCRNTYSDWIDSHAGYDISCRTEHIKEIKKRKTGSTAPEKGQQDCGSFFDAGNKAGE